MGGGTDIIATSGGDPFSFTVSGFKNGTQDDLTVRYNDEDYKGVGRMNDLDMALVANHRSIHDETDTFALFGDDFTISDWFRRDQMYDDTFGPLYSDLNEALKGNGLLYVWSSGENKWTRKRS